MGLSASTAPIAETRYVGSSRLATQHHSNNKNKVGSPGVVVTATALRTSDGLSNQAIRSTLRSHDVRQLVQARPFAVSCGEAVVNTNFDQPPSRICVARAGASNDDHGRRVSRKTQSETTPAAERRADRRRSGPPGQTHPRRREARIRDRCPATRPRAPRHRRPSAAKSPKRTSTRGSGLAVASCDRFYERSQRATTTGTNNRIWARL